MAPLLLSGNQATTLLLLAGLVLTAVLLLRSLDLHPSTTDVDAEYRALCEQLRP